MKTVEERLLESMFLNPKETKNIHNLTEDERAECSNGYNSSIEIIINDGDILVTGGTLKERCLLTDSDVDMEETLKQTTIDDVIKVSKEEEVRVYVFEDIVIVLSDIHYESNEERTYYLPISTDLTMLEGIEINDLR